MQEWFNKYIDIKDIITSVIASIIIALIFSPHLREFIMNLFKKKKVESTNVNLGSSATYSIKIKKFNNKVKVHKLIEIINQEIEGKAFLVHGSEKIEDELIVFEIQVNPKSIDHQKLWNILSLHQNGEYNVHTVSHIA